jgi:hypothetical protein
MTTPQLDPLEAEALRTRDYLLAREYAKDKNVLDIASEGPLCTSYVFNIQPDMHVESSEKR